MTAPKVVYATIGPNKHAASVVGSQFLCGFVQQGNALVPQQFASLTLGIFPGGYRFFDQALPLRGQPKGLSAGVFARHDFQPAVRPHPFHVPAESGRVELQDVAYLDGPGEPGSFRGTGAALEFDAAYQPKPAYDAIQTALRPATPK